MRIIDSHTGGEPTRIIVEGGPDLGKGTMAERLAVFREQFDHIRKALILEPRGHEVIVGALLCEPVKPEATAGILFFNNEGYLGMCGHGTIGLTATLSYLGKAKPGLHLIETPVGDIQVEIVSPHKTRLTNVPSWLYKKDQALTLPSGETFVGDIAWGGNWFFLINEHQELIALSNKERLQNLTREILYELDKQNIRGADNEKIDHVEIFSATDKTVADSRNFVMCPGGEYDRSPCGTGTSAKLACLAARGKLAENTIWRQQSITGSVFRGSYQWQDQSRNRIIPQIEGEAWVTLDAEVIINDLDPLKFGIQE